MPRVWLGNFDFETTLAGETPPGELDRLANEWAFAFLPLVEDGDVIVADREFDRGFVEELQRNLGLPEFEFRSLAELAGLGEDYELIPWGWSPAVHALGRRVRLRMDVTRLDAVRKVHCREFSFQLAHELKVATERVCRVRDINELQKLVHEQPAEQRWAIKSQWGASGRGQLRRKGNTISEQDLRWGASLLRRDGVLFFEPWLNAIAEAGIQFHIPVASAPELIAVVPMLTDRHGQYVGSIVPVANDAATLEEWRDAVDIGRIVCDRVQSEGYHGPVGIDAMRYVNESGAVCVRPIQEINARWTMGRLAAAWRRYLPPLSNACWVRVSFVDPDETTFQHRLPTGPASIGGQETRWRMELRWK